MGRHMAKQSLLQLLVFDNKVQHYDDWTWIKKNQLRTGRILRPKRRLQRVNIEVGTNQYIRKRIEYIILID